MNSALTQALYLIYKHEGDINLIISVSKRDEYFTEKKTKQKNELLLNYSAGL